MRTFYEARVVHVSNCEYRCQLGPPAYCSGPRLRAGAEASYNLYVRCIVRNTETVRKRLDLDLDRKVSSASLPKMYVYSIAIV